MGRVLKNFKFFIKDSFPGVSKWIKVLLHPYRKIYNNRYNKKICSDFHLKAVTTFSHFCQALDEANVKFWLTFGTLLGAIREKGFISHDFDIDVAVFSDENLTKAHDCLLKNGFKLSREICIYTNNASAVGYEKTYTKDSVSIDIFIFYKENEQHVYTYDFLDGTNIGNLMIYKTVRKISLPFDGLTEYKFLNNKVHIPSKHSKYLEAHYGADFMVPNPNWTTRTSPAATVIDGAVGIEVL